MVLLRCFGRLRDIRGLLSDHEPVEAEAATAENRHCNDYDRCDRARGESVARLLRFTGILRSLRIVEILRSLHGKRKRKIPGKPEEKRNANRVGEIFSPLSHHRICRSAYGGSIQNEICYIVLGIQLDGQKDILGVWIGEHESAKFWLSVMNDLRNRGIKDVYVFCVDGLNGFKEAINAAFPHSQIQRCIIHQIRSSTKYVSYKDIKAVMADLKKIYQAINEDEARNALIQFKENWAKTYPSCVRSWDENWDILSTFFAYPAEVRRIIYTTNIIEGLNRQFRKITKNKPSFTNDDSLRKMLYLASQNIVNHWTVVCRNWDMVSNQLRILFEDRETV
jgi:transposase-like protein